MTGAAYNSFLTSLGLLSFAYICYSMTWDGPSDARDLATHCSKYVLDKDNFSDLALLASGNSHVVWTASLCCHKGKVAVKRWHGAAVSNRERRLFAQRLISDIDRWRNLISVEPHPNILPVLGVALHLSNLPALVVPCYPTANEVLQHDGQVDVLPLLQDVAAGLSFLHSRPLPIAHGDIKGSTILISMSAEPTTRRGTKYTALLSDIGIASIPQPPDWVFHGVDDARWLAPEIMDPSLRPPLASDRSRTQTRYDDNILDPSGTLSVTPESDIYSFAMLGYELYSRKRPFSATTWSAAVVVNVVRGNRPARPSEDALWTIPDQIWTLLECCWKQNWQERPRIDTVAAWLSVLSHTHKASL
ncbi:Protein kinase domain-containing protein [Mycena kentingensis (nom. inval.)]|nr:Protein kinase domain-containing protein [Mycena kentingensis (nom. inval.)]